MTFQRQPRRANLATIVGSGLAVVAAGSLLAFSTLAEQAGLEGLATRRLQPTHPAHAGRGAHVITVPAPATAPPGDPRDELAELVRATVDRDRVRTAPVVAFQPPAAPSPQPDEARPDRSRRVEPTARVAVTEPAAQDEAEAAEPDGPPYGHAYGHYKEKHKAPKHEPRSRSSEQPVYARSANDETESKPPKAPKMKKVKKVKPAGNPGNGKAKGHSEHGNGNGYGHSKHAGKSNGKGKGHSKHGD